MTWLKDLVPLMTLTMLMVEWKHVMIYIYIGLLVVEIKCRLKFQTSDALQIATLSSSNVAVSEVLGRISRQVWKSSCQVCCVMTGVLCRGRYTANGRCGGHGRCGD